MTVVAAPRMVTAMKKIARFVVWMGLCCTLRLDLATAAPATGHQFLLWYPGGGGNTAQAQPILDQFAAYLGTKTGGTPWAARYCGQVDCGLQFVRTMHPTLGIVSYLMFTQHGPTLGMQRVLAGIPLAHGKAEESWHFVAGECDETPAPLVIHTSEPLTLPVIRQHFSHLSMERAGLPATLQATGNLFGALKQIATGNCHAAIVSEREWRGVSGTGWAKSLHATPSDTTHPAAIVVSFNGAPTAIATQATQALRTMHTTAPGKAILTELQLKGFQ